MVLISTLCIGLHCSSLPSFVGFAIVVKKKQIEKKKKWFIRIALFSHPSKAKSRPYHAEIHEVVAFQAGQWCVKATYTRIHLCATLQNVYLQNATRPNVVAHEIAIVVLHILLAYPITLLIHIRILLVTVVVVFVHGHGMRRCIFTHTKPLIINNIPY